MSSVEFDHHLGSAGNFTEIRNLVPRFCEPSGKRKRYPFCYSLARDVQALRPLRSLDIPRAEVAATACCCALCIQDFGQIRVATTSRRARTSGSDDGRVLRFSAPAPTATRTSCPHRLRPRCAALVHFWRAVRHMRVAPAIVNPLSCKSNTSAPPPKPARLNTGPALQGLLLV